LRVIVAFMAAKSQSVPALSTKKVFISLFVQKTTPCMPSKVAGTTGPSLPAVAQRAKEGPSLGTSCPKPPAIRHSDNPDMRTLIEKIPVKSGNSGPAPHRDHTGYHRPPQPALLR
jgi:hypothetical protein